MLSLSKTLHIKLKVLRMPECCCHGGTTETLSWLELVNNRSCRVKLHVILQGVATVEPLGTQMTGEWHLSAVDEHVLLQMMFHSEPLWTLSATKWS